MGRKVFDVFADEYIDEKDKDSFAPPERYREVTTKLILENGARWFANALVANVEERG